MTNWILILNLVLYGINIGLSLYATNIPSFIGWILATIWILAYTFKKEN